jgi:glycosyltransferase involved in cell wall biosynthesis
MKKTLIISYNFPPVGGAGVQRPVKFVKYLRDFGWEPVVLSVSNPSVPVLDVSLLKDIPEGVKIYRGRTFEPSYALKARVSRSKAGISARLAAFLKKTVSRFILPDMQILWWPGLLHQLLKILRQEKPDVVFVSAPPFSSFVPVVFASSFFRVPVVLDYRDEWSFSRLNWENSVKTSFASRLDGILERYVLWKCSAFVAANQSYLDYLDSSYPGLDGEKGRAITNGYDDEDLGGLRAVSRDGQKIRITYAGTVWNATSLKTFMAALEMLFAEDSSGSIAKRMIIDIYGRVVDEERRCIEECKYLEVVALHGYMEHKDILQELMNSDILLLTLSDLAGADRIITGKAFEYMATGKHILAIAPKGETTELLRQNYRNLTLVEPDHPERVVCALRKLIASIEELRAKDGDDVTHFTRRNLTGELSRLFDELTGEKAT